MQQKRECDSNDDAEFESGSSTTMSRFVLNIFSSEVVRGDHRTENSSMS